MKRVFDLICQSVLLILPALPPKEKESAKKILPILLIPLSFSLELDLLSLRYNRTIYTAKERPKWTMKQDLVKQAIPSLE